MEKCAAATERGAVVALAVRNCSCAGCALHDVVPTLAAPSMVLLLPDDDDAPPRCAFSGAVPVASAPSGELLAALRRGASVALASTHPAPRLERTWRALEDLRDPANWPDDPRQRRRVRGAMRRVATIVLRAHLDATGTRRARPRAAGRVPVLLCAYFVRGQRARVRPRKRLTAGPEPVAGGVAQPEF